MPRGVMRTGIIAAEWCWFYARCVSTCLWLMTKLDPEWLKKAQEQGVVVHTGHPNIQEAEGGWPWVSLGYIVRPCPQNLGSTSQQQQKKTYTNRPTQFRVGFCYVLVLKGMRMRMSKISILVASVPWCRGCFPISFTTEPGAKSTCGVVGDNI